jgi:LuxR family maltose regulon positive regulatory protein
VVPSHLSLEGLTRREIEVLQHLASGDSNKVIARALDVSPNTVKRHVARILSRLGVSSRGEAASVFRGTGKRSRPSGSHRL